MPPASPSPPSHTLKGALAYVGVVVAYLPLLTLLLPLRVEAVAGDGRYRVLAMLAIAGALVASGANILFCWLSDRTLLRGGLGRRAWMVVGIATLPISYGLIASAWTTAQLVAATMIFQVGVNALLAPLLALLAEETPDGRKGLMSGLLAGGQPIAALLGPVLVMFGGVALGFQLGLVAAMTVACTVPLLLAGSRRESSPLPANAAQRGRRDLAFAWIARLAMQVAGNVLTGYLLFLIEDLSATSDRTSAAVRAGALLTIAGLLPLPCAVVLGRWSDRLGRRKPFLGATSLCAAAGLLVMAGATGWTAVVVGFCLYAIGLGTFLPLQTGFVMQMLPNPRWRGRDLGLINLTNTVPSLIGPGLTWALAAPRHLAPLLVTLAGLAITGGLVMQAVREPAAAR